MDSRKSSGVANMILRQYQYQFEKEGDKLRVFEFIDTYGSRIGMIWDMDKLKKSLSQLEKDDFLYVNKEEKIKSLQRTKNWLYENHPEILI
jgi:hypothetical protein